MEAGLSWAWEPLALRSICLGGSESQQAFLLHPEAPPSSLVQWAVKGTYQGSCTLSLVCLWKKEEAQVMAETGTFWGFSLCSLDRVPLALCILHRAWPWVGALQRWCGSMTLTEEKEATSSIYSRGTLMRRTGYTGDRIGDREASQSLSRRPLLPIRQRGRGRRQCHQGPGARRWKPGATWSEAGALAVEAGAMENVYLEIPPQADVMGGWGGWDIPLPPLPHHNLPPVSC